MNTQENDSNGQALIKRGVAAVGRSILSTLVIGLVATGIFAVRKDYYQLDEIKPIVTQNSALFGGIFIGLVLWNFWFHRPKKQRHAGPTTQR